MKLLLAVLVSATLLLPATSRSRPRRQFSWGNGDDDFVPPNNDQSSTTTPSGAGSTTTRAPVAYRNCLQTCQGTPEYNPVCGSDGETYSNVGKLKCAAQCGRRVTVVRGGTCAPL